MLEFGYGLYGVDIACFGRWARRRGDYFRLYVYRYRKRVAKERDMIRSEATGKALSAILPIYDNLERALAQETEDTEYKKGVEMTARQFESALDSLGVEIISAEPGTEFDPTVHNAVMHMEDESLGENCIAECFQKGFRHGDKIIRTAMVKVAN